MPAQDWQKLSFFKNLIIQQTNEYVQISILQAQKGSFM